MKILEIIDTEMQKRDSKDKYSRLYGNKRLIGSGYFAQVYKGDDDIEVTKVEPHGGKTSPYDIYVQAIVKGGLSSKNPYFPRVYVRRGFKGSRQVEYEIEQLIPLGTYVYENTEYIPYLSKKLFGDDVSKMIGEHPGKFVQAVDYLGSTQGRDEALNKAGDPVFREAIEILMNIKSANPGHLTFDLHAQNFMVRLTNTGPQVVITDPFS